jgi:tetratricopeptide (TPR) repeat protein
LIVIFLALIFMAGRAGFASLLTSYAARANVKASSDAAVALSPADPDAHLVRGELFETNNDLPSAIAEYEKAASLRPDDYVVWLSLARARELNGQMAEAIAAARRAAPLAPFYAQPHWQLGNILLRAGQRDEAFKELSLAGASNPVLLPAIIDLSWQLSNGDAQSVMRTINPQTAESSRALAVYFRKRGAVAEAIAMYRVAGADAEAVRARQQYVNELVSQKQFKEAFQVWAMDRAANPGNAVGVIIDPGFEQESNLDEPGFGWRRANKASSVKLSLDSAGAKEGNSSLRIDFNGDSDPGPPIISQLILLEPKTRYQLRFSVRAEDIVSGGLPNVQVIDLNTNNAIGQSGALPRAANDWREVVIDFLSGDASESGGSAVQISLLRDRCSTSPCPIYGHLWLDKFSLQRQ